MASSLRLFTSNLITRSFRPSVVSASRFLSISRSYTTMPVDDSYDQSWLKLLCPRISSMSFKMRMDAEDRKLEMKIRGAETGEGLNVDLKIPVDIHSPWCLGGLKLPEDKISNDFKEELKDEMLKDDVMANITGNIISSFRDITAERSWPYYDMFFDRSILGKGLCPAIAMLGPIYSFSIFKNEDFYNSLEIKMSVPGHVDMKLSTKGLRVSQAMQRLEREDVKTFFDYDTFFIEGKTKTKHYITGIHLPESIHNKNYKVRTWMKNGVFHAILPHVKKEEIMMIN